MTTRTIVPAIALSLASLWGCSSGEKPESSGHESTSTGGTPGAGGGTVDAGGAVDAGDAPPIGSLCTTNAACASRTCENGRCTSLCGAEEDCPPAPEWTCAFSAEFGRTCACAPSGSETCDGRDNDCNGVVDDAACPGAEVCEGNACVCPPDRQCASGCFDRTSDVAHCGECDVVCRFGAICESGLCVCAGGGTACEGACVDLDVDPEHCGSCETACDALETCNAGLCECAHTVCGGTCVSLDDDPVNCGSCGRDCAGGACIDGRCEPTLLVADENPTSILAYDNRLYWLSSFEIRRAELDGTNVTDLATEQNFGGMVAPDIAATTSWFFFATWAVIYRMPLDGSAAPSVLINALSDGENLGGMTADETHLYWMTTSGDVRRSDHDGTNVSLLASGQSNPQVLIATPTSLYWASNDQYGGYSYIRRSNLDGSGAVTLWQGTNDGFSVSGSNLYWTDYSYIWQADLDGENQTKVAPGYGGNLQADDSFVYWLSSSSSPYGLVRAPLSGGAPTVLAAVPIVDYTIDGRFLYYTWNNYSSLEERGVMRLAK